MTGATRKLLFSECLAFPTRPACLVQLSCVDAGSGIFHHHTLRGGAPLKAKIMASDHGLPRSFVS